MKGTKEFYEIMDQFEKEAKRLFYGHKIDRVVKNDRIPQDQFYDDGFVNNMFQAFLSGYQYHKCISNLEQK